MLKEKENEQSNIIIKMSFNSISKRKNKNFILASSSCIVKISRYDIPYSLHFFTNTCNKSNISIMQV